MAYFLLCLTSAVLLVFATSSAQFGIPLQGNTQGAHVPMPKITFTSTTTSSTTPIPAGNSHTEKSSRNSFKGLIIGVVVGVVGGLILLGTIILIVLIFLRRRAKPQPKTQTNRDVPTAISYEISPSHPPPVLYDGLTSSTQLQTGTVYDNQYLATDPLAAEANPNNGIVQSFNNNAFHHSDAVVKDDRTSSENYDNVVQESRSNNDTETTVIENDLYGK